MSEPQRRRKDFHLPQLDFAYVRRHGLELPVARAAESSEVQRHVLVAFEPEPAANPFAEAAVVAIDTKIDVRLNEAVADPAFDGHAQIVNIDIAPIANM